jgi:hypothetical protein
VKRYDCCSTDFFLRLRREELLIEEEIIHVRNFNGNIKFNGKYNFSFIEIDIAIDIEY